MELPVADVTIQDLAHRCEEEIARYRRGETHSERDCMDLLRRALTAGDDDAWVAVHRLYSGAVGLWLGDSGNEVDAEIAAVFERFWHALRGPKFDRFASLPAVLQYLKMCAYAVKIDRGRAQRAAGQHDSLDERALILPDREDVAESAIQQVDAPEFWRIVQEILEDEQERRVVYLSYVIGLTPRDICARHPSDFADARDVYRLKRSALDRLRRAGRLQAYR
jgi:DNA-directed RNA polymerase specialized sigma24 family protein